MKIDVRVTGIEDVNAILASIAPREAKNLMRATVQDMAKQTAEIAIGFTPDDPSTMAGDLKSSIKAKRERGSSVRVESVVLVTNLKRNYFWRFLEYGQGPDRVHHAMFGRTLAVLRQTVLQMYLDAFTRKWIARLVRLRKAGAGG